MNAFEDSLEFLRWEGDISDHPDDRGGLTKFGISSAQFPDEDIANLTWERAQELYLKHYWLASEAHKFPYAASRMIFDMAVTHGASRAIRIVQKAVNAHVDGIVGPKTLTAVFRHPNLVVYVLAERARYFAMIALNDPAQAVFLRGWNRRNHDLQRDLMENVP